MWILIVSTEALGEPELGERPLLDEDEHNEVEPDSCENHVESSIDYPVASVNLHVKTTTTTLPKR